jgi:hypothetical protein
VLLKKCFVTINFHVIFGQWHSRLVTLCSSLEVLFWSQAANNFIRVCIHYYFYINEPNSCFRRFLECLYSGSVAFLHGSREIWESQEIYALYQYSRDTDHSNGLVCSICIPVYGRVPCVGVIESGEAVVVAGPGTPDEAVGIICVRSFGFAAASSSCRLYTYCVPRYSQLHMHALELFVDWMSKYLTL